jgi:hypothetical protein
MCDVVAYRRVMLYCLQNVIVEMTNLIFAVVVRTKAVKAKMDQPARRVLVSVTTHRTFGRPQWQQLGEQLRVWQLHITQILGGFVNLQKAIQQQQQQQQLAR